MFLIVRMMRILKMTEMIEIVAVKGCPAPLKISVPLQLLSFLPSSLIIDFTGKRSTPSRHLLKQKSVTWNMKLIVP